MIFIGKNNINNMEPLSLLHLHLFNTESEHNSEYNGSGYSEPWVAYTEETESVTFNKKSYLLEDILSNLKMYNPDDIIVMDETNSYWSYRYIIFSSGTSVENLSSYVSNGFTYEATLQTTISNKKASNHLFELPSNPSFLYMTNSTGTSINLDEIPTSDTFYFDGTISGEWYIVDFKNNVKYIVEKAKTTGESGSAFRFPNFILNPTQIEQREITDKKIYPPITLDDIQHASQLTDKTCILFEGKVSEPPSLYFACDNFNDDEEPTSVVAHIFSWASEDYFDVVGLTTESNRQTVRLTRKNLLSDNVKISEISCFDLSQLDINSQFTLALVVNDVEVATKTTAVPSGAEQVFAYAFFKNGEWGISVDYMQVYH